ncbi:MAG: tRNA (N6-isopentenyl adenosine(37)-C2)-methylthiotransferase MiaB, partial [Actinobacteria bacterium]|nr:tRNA (N6-isopentenyl adenosine(37)-C2)-methylthiotransferase MiaB [Actinomycetota bacterium]
MKVYIETFGCQMNENDSERIMYLLEKEGYERTYDIEISSLIILNTCTVREKAKNRLYGHIGNLKRLKSKNRNILICIGGCTAQDLKEKLIEDFP